MSNDPTIRVDPPAAPKGKRRPLRALGVGLCTFVLLLLGFSISSSLGARVSTSVLWLLLLGLGACVIVPALLGFWLRRVGRARERPRTLTMLCLCNALLVVVAAISAPSVTRAALSQHGAWWVESLARVFGAKDARNSAVVVKARALYSAMASVLPGSKVVAGSGSASATGSASGSGASPSTAAAKGDAAAGT
ncbi:MAG: hypothetical protein KC503_30970, partial [Myxococcales bacterium]|nr:hypothetical protein [Myxococcales bacterium]